MNLSKQKNVPQKKHSEKTSPTINDIHPTKKQNSPQKNPHPHHFIKSSPPVENSPYRSKGAPNHLLDIVQHCKNNHVNRSTYTWSGVRVDWCWLVGEAGWLVNFLLSEPKNGFINLFFWQTLLNRSTYTHLKKKWIARGGGYVLWLGLSAIFVEKTKAEKEGRRPGGLQGSYLKYHKNSTWATKKKLALRSIWNSPNNWLVSIILYIP